MMRFSVVLMGCLVAVLAGCSTTPIKAVWKDALYTGAPNRVMVIAVAEDAVGRRTVEDEFVLQLKTRGVDAIASYTILPERSRDDVAIIAKMIVQLGADSVLISRMASKNQVREYYSAPLSKRPLHYENWRDFYQDGIVSLARRDNAVQFEHAMMETNLYAAGGENLLWAVTTETGANRLSQILLKPYIGSILNTMADSGLLKHKV